MQQKRRARGGSNGLSIGAGKDAITKVRSVSLTSPPAERTFLESIARVDFTSPKP